MDIRMPKMDGVQCTKIIKDNYSEIKLLYSQLSMMMSMYIMH